MIGNLVRSFLASFFAYISYAVASLGSGILFQTCFFVFALFDLMSAQSLSDIIFQFGLSFGPIALVQTIYLRKHLNLRLGILIGIVNSLSIVFGIEVLVRYENIWLRRSLGFTILFFHLLSQIAVKIKVIRSSASPGAQVSDNDEYQQPQDETQMINIPNDNISDESIGDSDMISTDKDNINMESKSNKKIDSFCGWFGLIFAALISGFMYGIFGIAGPPWMIWLTITNFDKNIYRATMTFAYALFIVPTQTAYLIIVKNKFDMSNIFSYIIIFVGCFAGLMFGNLYLSKHVDQEMFQKFIKILLFIAALFISTSGIDIASMIIACIGAVIIILFVAIQFRQAKRFGLNEIESTPGSAQ